MTTVAETPPAETAPSATASPDPAPARRPLWRRPIAIGGAVAALVIAAVVAFVVLKPAGQPDAGSVSGDGPVASAPGGSPFRLVLPPNWRFLSKQQLAAAPGHPLAVLRRNDGKGVLVIRRAGAIPSDLKTFTRQLDRQLARRFKDFKRQSVKQVKVRAGRAYFYSYVLKRKGTVDSITIVPAAKGSYTLNSVAAGGQDDVAREIARMIVSFDF